jgi:PAS domain S-box-containing protein
MAEKSKSDRIGIIIDGVRKAVEGNFSIRIDASGKNDVLDALADGINQLLDNVAEQITAGEQTADALKERTEKYRQLIENMNDALAVGDANGVLTYVNPRFCEILATEEKALIGCKFIEFLDETNRNRWLEQQNKRRQGLSSTYELEITRRDGSKIVCSVSGGSVMDEDGRYAGSVGILTDITERKQMEEALRMFQSSIDRASDAVFWMDRQGRFSYVNEQACLSLGYSREELIRLRLWDIDPEFSQELWAKRWKERETVSVYRHESRHRRKDGVFFPVEVSAKHIRFSNSELHVAFVRDITERKLAEEALQKSQNLLDESQRLSHIGSWELNLATHELIWSDEIFRMFDLQPQEFQPTFEEFINRVHPDDRGLIPPHFRESLATKEFKDLDYRIMRPDGSVRWIHATGKVFCDDAGVPVRKVGTLQDFTERRQMEQALHLTQFCVDRALVGIFRTGSDGKFLSANDLFCRNLGYTHEELYNMYVWDIDSDFQREKWLQHRQELRAHDSITFESIHRRKDGTTFPVEITGTYLEYQGESFSFSFVSDITERKQAEKEKARLEMQLIQAQKMESVGRLAGGVAHDFNNMLGVILGYAELIKSRLAAEDPLFKDLLEIEKAANHSRDIARQLLAFSRKQLIEPRPLDLNDLVTNTQKTLSRLIGEDIELCVIAGKDLWEINFDPSQVDQILINLAVNARDAMLNGGKLTIETANVRLDEAYCREHLAITPGDYVTLVVSDSGVGIDQEILSHVFEPFFTTKEVGKGTGLGLATVYGIIKQNGGFIYIDSEPGRGTAFKIYIPRNMQEDEIAAKTEDSVVVSGSETILLVEDEGMVRGMTTAMLERIGYTVLVAETPQEALLFCEKNDVPIDLLLTDVVMPGMNGTELRDRIEGIRPGIKVLFMSGYTSDVIGHHGVLDKGMHFVQKPFSLKGLARKVRDAIEGRVSGGTQKGGLLFRSVSQNTRES